MHGWSRGAASPSSARPTTPRARRHRCRISCWRSDHACRSGRGARRVRDGADQRVSARRAHRLASRRSAVWRDRRPLTAIELPYAAAASRLAQRPARSPRRATHDVLLVPILLPAGRRGARVRAQYFRSRHCGIRSPSARSEAARGRSRVLCHHQHPSMTRGGRRTRQMTRVIRTWRRSPSSGDPSGGSAAPRHRTRRRGRQPRPAVRRRSARAARHAELALQRVGRLRQRR